MYKKILFMTVVSLFTATIMASCTAEPSTSSNETVDSQVTSSEENTAAVDEESSEIALESSETKVENDTTDGPTDPCTLHAWNYHSITGELTNYVGSEAFENWLDTVSGEEMNIVRFVNDFQIDPATFEEIVCFDVSEEDLDGMTLDEHYTKWGYNQKMREAIFSNDDYEISKAFASEYAVVAPDGQIYSLEWLAEHDAQDYQAYGLSADEIQNAVDRALERGITPYTTLAEQIEPELEQAYALEEAALSEQENSAAE